MELLWKFRESDRERERKRETEMNKINKIFLRERERE
jgi:hypothetical protein